MKKFRRKRGPVRSKKVMFDGITFASGLEKYMYIALKKAKLKVDMKVKPSHYKKGLCLIMKVTHVKAMVKVIWLIKVVKEYYL